MRRRYLLPIALALVVAAPMARLLSLLGAPNRQVATAEDDHRSRDLDAGLTDVQSREMVKTQVAARLVRGELDLDQAVARFRALGTTDPDRLDLIRRRYPAATDKELVYWPVLRATRGVTEMPSEHVEEAERRLFAVFRERFPRSPDPAADPYMRPVHR